MTKAPVLDVPLARPRKRDLALDWLPRYTDTSLGKFGDYIPLTNFPYYIEPFNHFQC